MEWSIVVVAIILSIVGIIALFSATYEEGTEEFYKQIGFLIASIIIMIITIFINYELLIKYAKIFYGIIIVLLIAVLFTEPISGATSWFNIGNVFSFQPSEFAKIAIVLFLTFLITKMQLKDTNNINKITRLLLIGVAVAIPILLIVNQPDYGTAMAIIASSVIILFSAGINKKYIFTAIIITIVSIPLLYLYVLPDHAVARIDVYLNPESDPRGDRIQYYSI